MSVTMTKEIKKLTKNDVKALKTCDSIVFYHNEDGQGEIKAIKESRQKGVFQTDKAEYFIPVKSRVDNYRSEKTEVKVCSHHIYHAKYTHWPTIAESIRENDEIVLVWRAGNNNKYLDDAGLFRDELFLEIHREVNGKRKVKRFLVDSMVCPNNVARMCRTWW